MASKEPLTHLHLIPRGRSWAGPCISICSRDLSLHIITHVCKTQIIHIHNPPCECLCVGGWGECRYKSDKIYRKIVFCFKASSWLLLDSVAAVAEKWLEVSLAENRVDGGGDRVLRLF